MATLAGLVNAGLYTETEGRTVSFQAPGTLIFDLDAGPFWYIDFSGVNNNITGLTMSNVPSTSGIITSFILKITQGSTARQFDWGLINKTKWADNHNSAPTITTTDNAIDILAFTTWDNGTTWYGTVVGQDIK